MHRLIVPLATLAALITATLFLSTSFSQASPVPAPSRAEPRPASSTAPLTLAEAVESASGAAAHLDLPARQHEHPVGGCARRGVEFEAVKQALAQTAAMTDMHDLHVWAISSRKVSMIAHIVVDASASDPFALMAQLRGMLAERALTSTEPGSPPLIGRTA